ncbi:amidohydrolase [Nocardioides jishulii]|uniref:Amidohydrolase n=1 Tax=Nocardioides jishulii TaxID=2575440 RepID=A0A4U2YR41_9ACTN|nr:amidohydrolase family protein [Nocardioides jishulii]QCX26290.1 amidohydrolase family protein [Nocardioides jishulii]TKI63906.1 amidohydrolase [Nocardioides jishulii]
MLLRNVRPVPLLPGRQPVADPVDLDLPGVGEPAQVLDADGAWAVPGLWDAHVHLGQWTLVQSRLDTSAADSVEDVLAAVRSRLTQRLGHPVIGFGHRPTAWPTGPTTAALDAVTDTPVVLVAGDAHHGWLNSSAQRILGLPLRDEVVSEDEWFAVYARLGDVFGSERVAPGDYAATLGRAAALGVTGVVDFEFGEGPGAWIDRWSAGADLLRVRTATYASGLADVLAEGWRTGDVLDRGGRLMVGPLKIISDGSLNTGTAWCCEPYAGAPALPYGEPNLEADELQDLLARAHAGGLEAAVHAIGDRAVEAALDAFAATGARGSVEHAQLVRRDDVRRMRALGVRASVQPAHLLDDRDPTEQQWPGRGGRCFALRWMRDAGVQLAFGSDAPVSPLDPWLAMAAAVHRSADEREGWHPEQSLTATEALAASVDGVGDLATARDVVLLGDDPLRFDTGPEAAAHLRSMRGQVLATYVDGRGVYVA